MNHWILSNLVWVWSRGTFDPIVINGETISHTVRDLGVYIDSSINLADHVPRLTTKTFFFQIRQSRSIRLLLTIKFSHTWLLLLSIIATAFLVENYAKCVISPLFGESETHRAALVGHFRKNCVQDWRACSPMPSWICSTLSDTSRQ